MSKEALLELFGENVPKKSDELNNGKALQELFGEIAPKKNKELNGVEAANKAVKQCAPDSTIIFLKRSEYDDLIYRANLPELKVYKGKKIFVVSDTVAEAA